MAVREGDKYIHIYISMLQFAGDEGQCYEERYISNPNMRVQLENGSLGVILGRGPAELDAAWYVHRRTGHFHKNYICLLQ